MQVITASKMISKPYTDGIMWLEKAEGGQVSVADIGDALEEFERLFKAGIASKAEKLTLARAFPENIKYTEAASKYAEEDEPMVVGGPASVSLVDREGHLITTDALKKAFAKFMDNFRTRNAMVLHSDVQVGWALPAYITKGGQIFKSGVDDKGLFFICELRDDTKISEKVMKEINEGRLRSYSIAGSALKVQNMQKGLVPYMQVDDMELAEVTVCEKGVNQAASFDLLKAEMPQTGKIDKDQCGYRDATMDESMRGENCGHCKFFNAQDKTCDTVVGDIQPGDWCKIFEPMEEQPKQTKVVVVMRDKQNVDFKKSFDMWMEKADTNKDPLKAKESLATLQNFAGREAEHHRLLQEFGFPSEQPAESARYNPVVETETDDKGVPGPLRPPWVVNEAGQDMGEKLDEDSPEYNKSDKAKNRKKANAVQKMGFLFKKINYQPPPVQRNPAGQRAFDDAQRQAEWQRGASGTGLRAGRTRRMATLKDREARNRLNTRGRVSTTERVDPRGASGRKGIDRINPSMADIGAQERADMKERIYDRQQAEAAKKMKGSDESKARREGASNRGILGRLRQRFNRSGRRRLGREMDDAGEKLTDKINRGADRSRLGLDRFVQGTKAGYKGKGKLQEGVGQKVPMEARAGKFAGKKAEEAKRAVGGALRGAFRNEDYESQMAGEGKAGQFGRKVGLKGRNLVQRLAGQTPEQRAKREADKQFAGSAVQPGGFTGRTMGYDEHINEFKSHNEKVQSNGHDTHENFLHNLQRLGMTSDRQRMFTVRHGKGAGGKMQDNVHAQDFLDGEGKDWDIEIHPDFAQHADEIHAYLGEYKQHMSGAPGKDNQPQMGAGSGGTANKPWQDAQAAATTQPADTGPAQTPIKVPELRSTQQNIGGAGGPTSSTQMPEARKKQQDFLNQPPDNINLSIKKSKIDKMLLKALGVTYATKRYSKTN